MPCTTVGIALRCAALGFAVGAATTGAAGKAAPRIPSMDLFARATDPNPTLNSYTATVRLSAVLRAATPVRESLAGTVYYVRPKRKIEFAGDSGPLRRFADLASATPSYEQAMQEYAIAPLSDDGTVSTYRLTPRKPGDGVKNIVVTIADKTALLRAAKWTRADGGTVALSQTYARVGNFRLPNRATIAARFPGYDADGTLTFGDYRPNATSSP